MCLVDGDAVALGGQQQTGGQSDRPGAQDDRVRGGLGHGFLRMVVRQVKNTGQSVGRRVGSVGRVKILVTAFDPFGGDAVNPALEAVRLLPPTIAGAELVTLEVPTVFGRSIRTVTAAIDAHQPDAVLCVGQAGGRSGVTPERVAINVDDARIPDNEGNQPIDRPVVDGGAPAHFSNLPVKAMVQAITEAGLPGELSNTAGTFVCNHLMYGVLHHLARQRLDQVRAGFVHVPLIPEQVTGGEVPCLPLADIARALTVAIEAVVAHDGDLRLAMGATH